jgi:hypothetical protein
LDRGADPLMAAMASVMLSRPKRSGKLQNTNGATQSKVPRPLSGLVSRSANAPNGADKKTLAGAIRLKMRLVVPSPPLPRGGGHTCGGPSGCGCAGSGGECGF